MAQSTPTPIKWLLLSTANVNRHVVQSLKLSEAGAASGEASVGAGVNQLYAVASRTKESAAKYAEANEIPVHYGSYQEGLEDSNVDVVYISLPNQYHHEWVLKALRAKKHVLCEKPMGLTEAQVAEMHTVAKEEGRLLMEGYMYLHTDLTQRVVELMQDFTGPAMLGGGELPITLPKEEGEGDSKDSGKLPPTGGGWKAYRLQGSFSFEIKDRGGHRVGTAATGGGALWDIGCYLVSYATLVRRYCADLSRSSTLDALKPTDIKVANAKLDENGSPVEADFYLTYPHAEDFSASFHVSFLKPVHQSIKLYFAHQQRCAKHQPRVHKTEADAKAAMMEEVEDEMRPPGQLRMRDPSENCDAYYAGPPTGQIAAIELVNPFKPQPNTQVPITVKSCPKYTDMIKMDTYIPWLPTDPVVEYTEMVTEKRFNHLYRGEVECLGAAVGLLKNSSSYDAAKQLMGGAAAEEHSLAVASTMDLLHKNLEDSSKKTET